MPNSTHYPNAIAHIRRKRKLSQEELARLVGSSVASVRRWEDGKATPSLTRAIGLAVALKVPIIDLFGEQSQSLESKIKRGQRSDFRKRVGR